MLPGPGGVGGGEECRWATEEVTGSLRGSFLLGGSWRLEIYLPVLAVCPWASNFTSLDLCLSVVNWTSFIWL